MNNATSFWLRILTLLVTLCGQVASQNKVVFCYYTNWSQYRQTSSRKFFPSMIDPSHCTHLVFAFVKLSGNALVPFEWNDKDRLYPEFNAKKNEKPGLKTLLAVGGFNLRSEPFTAMSSTASNRAQFVTNTITYLRANGFDGLDIDWEYPGHAGQGGVPADKQNYVSLIQELRRAFESEATQTGRERLLLTAAVGVGFSTVSSGYDIPQLNQYLDFIGLMTYDLHGAWDPRTGHNSALYTATSDTDNFSVMSTAQNFVQQGASKAKLLVGLATYGRSFRLTNSANTAVGASASGGGNSGPDSMTPGVLFGYEVCNQAINQGYTRAFDQVSKVPYLYKGDQWITYDDTISLQYKMSWINQNNYGGAIVWAIDQDDFNGQACGAGNYPLLSTISRCLINGVSCNPGDGGTLPPTTPAPVTTTTTTTTTLRPPPTTAVPTTRYPLIPTIRTTPITTPTTTPPALATVPPGSTFQCPAFSVGYFFADPMDCTAFYVCFQNRQWRFVCSPGTVYDPDYTVCSYNVEKCRQSLRPQRPPFGSLIPLR